MVIRWLGEASRFGGFQLDTLRSVGQAGRMSYGAQQMRIDQLSQRWKRAPRRWGHPLHSLCSYFAMFPPQIPSVFIRWLTEPGDHVYDPFSGRGTVPLEAILLGRTGWGTDANPLAVTLTGAKTNIPSQRRVLTRLCELEEWAPTSGRPSVPPDIDMLFSTKTLRQLDFLRTELDLSNTVDRFIAAMVLGILHANARRDGTPRGLSISMPNTFSMAPGYVRRYIHEHGLEAPKVNVFDALRARVTQLELPPSSIDEGHAWKRDVARPVPEKLRRKVKLLFTSPPYLEVIKYGKYNWVRLWFLGYEPRDVDEQLMATSSLDKYLDFMETAMTSLAPSLRTDGRACLVIGDVRRGDRTINLAREVWTQALEPNGWHLEAIVSDHLPVQHKVSRIWKDRNGKATKTDRILILTRGESGDRLPTIPRMSWAEPAW